MSTPGHQRPDRRAPAGPAGAGRTVSASPAPGYCTLTATSRPSCQRPRCTWPIDAAAVGPPSSQTSWSRQSAPRSRGEHVAHRLRRHRRRGVLQPGELLAVGRRELVGQRRLEHRQRLAELHRAALELARGCGTAARRCAAGSRSSRPRRGAAHAACRSPSAVRPAYPSGSAASRAGPRRAALRGKARSHAQCRREVSGTGAVRGEASHVGGRRRTEQSATTRADAVLRWRHE